MGTALVYHEDCEGNPYSYIDAYIDGHYWRVIAPDRYQAVCELMEQ